jgi:broad specificity phosphatase PhoE
MTVERVLLIRHGQTEWNAQRRWQGKTHDVTLNDEGRVEARALGEHLKTYDVAAIYSSDQLRSWETATIVGEILGITPKAEIRMREVNAGVFEGRTWPEVETHYPEHAVFYRENMSKMDYRFPEGETWLEVQERAHAAFQDITTSENGPVVALFSHGGTLRRLISRLFPDTMTKDYALHNTSITTIERSGDSWTLTSIGITPHLPKSPADAAPTPE